MKKFLLFIALVLSFAFDANAAKQSKTQGDETSEVICSIVKYTQSIGGPMITVVINRCSSACNIWQNALACSFCTRSIYCRVFWCTKDCNSNSTRHSTGMHPVEKLLAKLQTKEPQILGK